MKRLKQRGIDTRACYPLPLYDQPIFSTLTRPNCPNTETACAGILNPPMYHGLTKSDQQRVATELMNVLAELNAPPLRKAV
jgi:dTDP-4-amino-4,6-dideoxygalactose transaminase